PIPRGPSRATIRKSRASLNGCSAGARSSAAISTASATCPEPAARVRSTAARRTWGSAASCLPSPEAELRGSVRDLLRPETSWVISPLLAYLGFALALVLLAHLLRQRRSPSSTIAWLLVILLLPYLGVPLYLMFGGRKMRRMAGRKEPVYS